VAHNVASLSFSSHHPSGVHGLDVVVKELRELERTTGLQRTLNIGQLVFQRFFGGSIEAWRERRRGKHNSVRRLAAHPDCPLSRSALNQAIGVFVTIQRIPSVRTFGHIGASHIAAVSHLSVEAQHRWLEKAERHRWGVRELKEHMVAARRQSGERRGRPKSRAPHRLLSETRRLVDRLERSLTNLAQVDLEPADNAKLVALSEQLQRLAGLNAGVPRRSGPPPAMSAQGPSTLLEAG
jgi:hypothetical protein